MEVGLSGVLLFVFCVFVVVVPTASEDRHCKSYTDAFGSHHDELSCNRGWFCCGSCSNRYCCDDGFWRFDDDKQDECDIDFDFDMDRRVVAIVSSAAAVVIFITLFICCVYPRCCLYKMCRKPSPVIATTTRTTAVTSTPQRCPQQPTVHAPPPQSYQGTQYPGHQPIPVQPPGYGAQPMPQGYGAPTAPYQGQPYAPGPPPPYQEAAPPGYSPAPMPYSQAAYAPGQPAYPLQPPALAQPQPNAPPPPGQPESGRLGKVVWLPDYLAQPAYNPAYAPPPPNT